MKVVSLDYYYNDNMIRYDSSSAFYSYPIGDNKHYANMINIYQRLMSELIIKSKNQPFGREHMVMKKYIDVQYQFI